MTEYSHPDIEEARRLAETGADLMPRYSMKRMRDELRRAKEFARREALEEAAKIADDWLSYHPAEKTKFHNISAAIRALSDSTPTPLQEQKDNAASVENSGGKRG